MAKRICCVTVFILLFVYASNGQAEISFGFDPLLVERFVQPGDVIIYDVNIDNNNRFESLTLDLFVADVQQRIDGVYIVVPLNTTPYSLGSWVKVEPSRVTIPPGGSTSAKVTVTIPRGVSGGRYGAIVAQVVPDTTVRGDASGVSTFLFQAASFLELTISGNAASEAYITSFDLRPSSEFLSIKMLVGDDAYVFSVAVENTGKQHIIATGELLLLTEEGRVVNRYPLGVGRGVILPNSTVYLQTVCTAPLPPGNYQAKATVSYGGRRPLVSSFNFSIDKTAVSQSTASVSQVPVSRFSIAPDNLEVILRPGAFQSAVLEITNLGQKPLQLEGYVLPLEFDLYGDLVPEAARGTSVPWIQLNPQSFTVAPGRTQRVRLTLQPPRDWQTSYFADILFRSIGEGANVEAGINLIAYLGDNLKKLGNVEIADVVEVEEGLVVDALFTNEGSAAVTAAVEVVMNRLYSQIIQENGQIIPARTETIATLALPTSESPILPGAQRLFSFMIPNGLEVGEYELLLRVDYGGDEPAITRLGITVGGVENE